MLLKSTVGSYTCPPFSVTPCHCDQLAISLQHAPAPVVGIYVCVCWTVLTTAPLTVGMREHPPVAICDLADHMETLKANDNLRFSQEYEVTLLLKAMHTFFFRFFGSISGRNEQSAVYLCV